MHQQYVIWVLPLVCLTWWKLSRGKAGPRRPSSLAGWHLRGLNCGILCKMEHPFPSSKGSRASGSSGAASYPLEGEESVSTLSGGPRGLGTHSGGGCSHCRQGAPATVGCESIPTLQPRGWRAARKQPAHDGTAPLHLFLPANAQPGRRPPLCTGNTRATSLITQHCHFKQLTSWGKNLIISDESSSLFGWESVVGGLARHADEAGGGHGKGRGMAPVGEQGWDWGPTQGCQGWRHERCLGMPGRDAVAQGNLQPGPRVAQGGQRDAAHAVRGLESSSRCRKSKQRREEDMQRFRAPGPRAGGECSCCSWEMLGQPWACPQVG